MSNSKNIISMPITIPIMILLRCLNLNIVLDFDLIILGFGIIVAIICMIVCIINLIKILNKVKIEYNNKIVLVGMVIFILIYFIISKIRYVLMYN